MCFLVLLIMCLVCLSVCVCMYICIYVYVCMYMKLCVRVIVDYVSRLSKCLRIYACMHTCMHVCVRSCIRFALIIIDNVSCLFIHKRVCLSLYASSHAYLRTYAHACAYMYTYLYVRTHACDFVHCVCLSIGLSMRVCGDLLYLFENFQYKIQVIHSLN